jgi:hypothetical protein
MFLNQENIHQWAQTQMHRLRQTGFVVFWIHGTYEPIVKIYFFEIDNNFQKNCMYIQTFYMCTQVFGKRNIFICT